jgi:GTP1/Obg family GTP-binding protein
LSEAKDKVNQHFGKNILKELQLLCHWAKAPPDQDQWCEFYQRFIDLIFDHHQLKNEAGSLARSLIKQIDSLAARLISAVGLSLNKLNIKYP